MVMVSSISGLSHAMGSMLCGIFRNHESRGVHLSLLSRSMLSPSDVRVDSHSDPTIISLHLHSSKTDVFCVGVWVLVDGPICPVKALLGYLAIRGDSPGPLFLFEDGRVLSRSLLVEAVRATLQSRGYNVRHFNGHSFRIGAATTAAACGVPHSLIQTLGRRSSAFRSYICTPMSTFAATSSRLLSQSGPT